MYNGPSCIHSYSLKGLEYGGWRVGEKCLRGHTEENEWGSMVESCGGCVLYKTQISLGHKTCFLSCNATISFLTSPHMNVLQLPHQNTLHICWYIETERPLAITFSSGSNTNNNSNGNITLSDRIIQYFEATTFLLLLLLCSMVESRLSRGVPEVQGVSEKMFFFLKKDYASFPLLAGNGLWLVVRYWWVNNSGLCTVQISCSRSNGTGRGGSRL